MSKNVSSCKSTETRYKKKKKKKRSNVSGIVFNESITMITVAENDCITSP